MMEVALLDERTCAVGRPQRVDVAEVAFDLLPLDLGQTVPGFVDGLDLRFRQRVPCDVAQRRPSGEVLPQQPNLHLPEKLPRCVVVRHYVTSFMNERAGRLAHARRS